MILPNPPTLPPDIRAVIENQAAYIQGWLKALKKDSKLLVNAAAQAQKAADYIMRRGMEFTI